jgi:hypothetical protein
MKITGFSTKPDVLQSVGQQMTAYRWNIKETTTEHNGVTTRGFSAYEVMIDGTVTVAKIKQAVLNAMWGKDQEAKYINDFNAANAGILDASYIDVYKTFLTERKALKDKIDADCKLLNVPAE